MSPANEEPTDASPTPASVDPMPTSAPGVAPRVFVEGLHIREIGPADLAAERVFIAELSPTSLRARTLGGAGEPTDDQLRKLVTPTPPREMVLGAFLTPHAAAEVAVREALNASDPSPAPDAPSAVLPASERIIGVARFAPGEIGDDVCDFAVAVTDPAQRRGVGRALLSALIPQAAAAGYQAIEGQCFADNQGMIALAKSLGFTVGTDPQDPALFRLRRALI